MNSTLVGTPISANMIFAFSRKDLAVPDPTLYRPDCAPDP